jgi:ACDE family multidrug resistance protein
VLGAPTHGGLSALMDASASQELMRHTSSNVLIVNPAAPMVSVTASSSAAVAMAQGSGPGSETA